MATILVTGGTGTLGRQVVDRLRTDGHSVRVLSRSAQPYAVDLRDDDSRALDRALEGADAVVHCATSTRGGDDRAAAHLVEAAVRAKVGHLLYVSIVGVDRLPLGYYRTKRIVERMVEDSGIGWTILRTTQFHDLVLRMLEGATKLPVAALLPAEVSLQPIGSAEVASRLADLATRPPSGRVPDLGDRRSDTPGPGRRVPAGGAPPAAAGVAAAVREGVRGLPRGAPARTRTGGGQGDVRGLPRDAEVVSGQGEGEGACAGRELVSGSVCGVSDVPSGWW